MASDQHSSDAGDLELVTAVAADIETLLSMMEDFNAGEQIAVEPTALRRALEKLLGAPELGRVWLIQYAGKTVGHAVLTFGTTSNPLDATLSSPSSTCDHRRGVAASAGWPSTASKGRPSRLVCTPST